MGAKTSWLMLVVTPLCCFINIPPQSVSLETSYQWVIRAGIPARSRSQRKSWKRWTKWNSGEKEHTIMLLYIHIIYYIILYIILYCILYYIVYYIILYCILYYSIHICVVVAGKNPSFDDSHLQLWFGTWYPPHWESPKRH